MYSDSSKVGKAREKELSKGSSKAPFESISGSRAMHWNLKVLNTWTNMRKKMMEEKAGFKKQKSKKGLEKSMPAAWREFPEVRIPLPDEFPSVSEACLPFSVK